MATGDNILEAVTADTLAHEAARASKHSLPIGAPCPNCHTALAGPWCYACGQRYNSDMSLDFEDDDAESLVP